MSAPKFTPGPWYAKSGDSQMCSEDTTVARLGQRASDATHWWIFSPANDHGDSDADADLIAAAPELYAALAALMPAVDSEIEQRQFGGYDKDFIELKRLSDAAHAALAKAVQP